MTPHFTSYCYVAAHIYSRIAELAVITCYVNLWFSIVHHWVGRAGTRGRWYASWLIVASWWLGQAYGVFLKLTSFLFCFPSPSLATCGSETQWFPFLVTELQFGNELGFPSQPSVFLYVRPANWLTMMPCKKIVIVRISQLIVTGKAEVFLMFCCLLYRIIVMISGVLSIFFYWWMDIFYWVFREAWNQLPFFP